MAAALTALSLLAGAAGAPTKQLQRSLRLLEFGENETRWVPLAQIDNLTSVAGSPHPNFFDVTDSRLPKGWTPPLRASRIPDEPIHEELVQGYLDLLNPNGIFQTISHLSSYFNRYYTAPTGRAAVLWLEEEYKEAAAGRPDVTIQLFEHEWEQPSLIVTILGKGDNKEETVVLGGHIDSTAGGASAESPGADDDASGSATVLEVFRTLMANRFVPDRTVEFHAYAAEEAGLRGSQAISEQYSAEGRDVVSMVQMDMVGYPNNVNTPLGLTTDYVDTKLSTFVGKCVDVYSRLKHEPSVCGYACSDHASWTKVGVPSSFPFEARFSTHNPAIHTRNDVLSNLSRDRCNEFARFGLGYVVELSLNP